ncbi:MAG: hypothetical protein WC413_02985 [Candidatus Nanoarchaeia archaeon]
METYRDYLDKDTLELKVKDIEARFGVDEAFLFLIVNDPIYLSYCKELSKNAIKKFRRYLQPTQVIFNYLSRNKKVMDKLIANKKNRFFGEYDTHIKNNLNPVEYQMYLQGNWNEAITSVVLSAQREFMYPERTKTKQELKGKAKQAPVSSYSFSNAYPVRAK